MVRGIEQKNLVIKLFLFSLMIKVITLTRKDFITGWLSNENAWGRPVSPLVMKDGTMLLSDDKHNVIYRISYKG